MDNESKPGTSLPRHILVAGDVCLDVVGVPIPPKAPEGKDENWRLTGETRTHFLPGGALLLTEFVRAAAGGQSGVVVSGPTALLPEDLNHHLQGPLDAGALIQYAPRLCRKEIVHSLIEAAAFPTRPDSKKEDKKTLRVKREAGFSGPDEGEEPSLQIQYQGNGDEAVIVLDDTGNRFRKAPCAPGKHEWPKTIQSPARDAGRRPLVIYKLHRPLPEAQNENALWKRVEEYYPERRIVVVSVDDLRATGVPISLGLSWERTALDVVWQLMNAASFAKLRECPWLVIRLGLDGAVLWRRKPPGKVAARPGKTNGGNEFTEEAWLVYDPQGIEGNFAKDVPGRMVGAGSAFVAGLVAHVGGFLAMPEDQQRQKLFDGMRAGLLAARRLFQKGFGMVGEGVPPTPAYPGGELFGLRDDKNKESEFACQSIPIIPGALCPDRGGWRLLDQIFKDKTSLLHRAVMQLAVNRNPPKHEGGDEHSEASKEWRAAELLKQAPLGIFGKLRTHDRREMEHYRSLHALLRDYLCNPAPPRPLSFAVFGPPGAGKSFGVKEVAASLKGEPGCREVKELT